MTTEISKPEKSMDRRGALKALFGFVAVATGASIVLGAGEAAAATANAGPQPAVEPVKADMASDDTLPESVETQYYYRRRVVRRRVYRRPVYRRRVYRPVYRTRTVYRRRPGFYVRF